MHCPHCHAEVTDRKPSCPNCTFTIADLDATLGPPPPRPECIHDASKALDAPTMARLEARCREFRERSLAEILVAIVTTSGQVEPSELVFWLFNRWSVGGESHRGLLVLVCLDNRRIDCEVGYGLEDIVSDTASTQLLREHAAPALARGQLGDGIFQAVDVLAKLIEAEQATPSRWRSWIKRWS